MEMVKVFLPTVLVFCAFIAALIAFCIMSVQGTDTGPVDELLIGLGGAVAGIAAPTIVAEKSS